MKGNVRFLIALLVSACLDFILFSFSTSLFEVHKVEVKDVIRISLIEPRKEKVTIREIRKKKPGKKEDVKYKPVKEKPKLESTKPKKELPAKKEVQKEKKRSKGSGGLKPLSGNLPITYIDAVKRAIQDSIFYPVEAIEQGKEGRVEVVFTVNRSGLVLECKGISGDSILQRAACISIKRANIPPVPETVKNSVLTFQLEVNYDLQKALSPR